jgi:hypothetical protein
MLVSLLLGTPPPAGHHRGPAVAQTTLSRAAPLLRGRSSRGRYFAKPGPRQLLSLSPAGATLLLRAGTDDSGWCRKRSGQPPDGGPFARQLPGREANRCATASANAAREHPIRLVPAAGGGCRLGTGGLAFAVRKPHRRDMLRRIPRAHRGWRARRGGAEAHQRQAEQSRLHGDRAGGERQGKFGAGEGAWLQAPSAGPAGDPAPAGAERQVRGADRGPPRAKGKARDSGGQGRREPRADQGPQGLRDTGEAVAQAVDRCQCLGTGTEGRPARRA